MSEESIPATTRSDPDTPQVTLESTAEAVEHLRKAFPEMNECSHPELVSSPCLLPSEHGVEHGMRYICTRCYKTLVIPVHMLITRPPRDIAGSIGSAFGPIWEQQAREQNTC